MQSREWDSDDGTRNKEVTITAEASDVPYTCVAAEIPSLGDQEQVASILLYGPLEMTTAEDSTAIHSTDSSGNQPDWLIGTNHSYYIMFYIESMSIPFYACHDLCPSYMLNRWMKSAPKPTEHLPSSEEIYESSHQN